jgi:hypothetical protein
MRIVKVGNMAIGMRTKDTDFEQWMGHLSEKLNNIEQNLKLLIGTINIFDGDDRLLDNQDLAFLLKVSKRTLQRYRTERNLTYFRIGHKTFYRVRDVKEFVNRHESYHHLRRLTL